MAEVPPGPRMDCLDSSRSMDHKQGTTISRMILHIHWFLCVPAFRSDTRGGF